jgi:hypothetical protein
VLSFALPEQFRESRDVERDATRLVGGEHLRLPRVGFVVTAVELGQRLSVGVPDDITAAPLVGMPRRREAAWWLAMSADDPASALSGAPRLAQGGKPSQGNGDRFRNASGSV